MLLALILLQAGAPPPDIRFDLARFAPPQGNCRSGGGEIVVCARESVRERAVALPDSIDPLPKAEIGLFGKIRGGVAAQQGLVGGFPSNRIMATAKIPF